MIESEWIFKTQNDARNGIVLYKNEENQLLKNHHFAVEDFINLSIIAVDSVTGKIKKTTPLSF